MNSQKQAVGLSKRLKKLDRYLYEIIPIPNPDTFTIVLEFNNEEENFFVNNSIGDPKRSADQIGIFADAIYSVKIQWSKYADVGSTLVATFSANDIFTTFIHAKINGRLLPKEALKLCSQKSLKPIVIPWHFQNNIIDIEDISILSEFRKCPISSELFDKERYCYLYCMPVDPFLRQRPLTHFIV